jgi:hypothetical protein
LPVGSTETEVGPDPVMKGLPATAESAPVVGSMAKASIWEAPEVVT